MQSGIYKISSLNGGKVYVGSAIDVRKRKNSHLHDLRKNKHHSGHLQNYFNKYGEQALVFETIEYCEIESLIEREQHYIDLLTPSFNVCRIAGSCLGNKMTEQQKLKLSIAHKGKKLSSEHRANISKSLKGKKRTEQARINISLGQIGKKMNPESVRRMIQTKTGKFLSEESKKNMKAGIALFKASKKYSEYREKMRAAANKRWNQLKNLNTN